MHNRDPGNGNTNNQIPNISFDYQGSTFSVYNLEQILANEYDDDPQIIYEASVPEAGIDSASIDVFIDKDSYPTDLNLNLAVALSNGWDEESLKRVFTNLLNTMSDISSGEPARHNYSVEDGPYVVPNYTGQFAFKTKAGLPLHFWYDLKQKLFTLGGDKITKPELIFPNHLTPEEQFIEFGRMMITFLDAFVSNAISADNTRLNNGYEVGTYVIYKPHSIQLQTINKNSLPPHPNDKNTPSLAQTTAKPLDTKPAPRNDEAKKLLDSISFRSESALSLDEVGGLEPIRQQLKDIAYLYKNPEVLKSWNAKKPQALLFYGPPGTGKTMLAQALANEMHAEMLTIQSSEIYDIWLGNSDKNIKKIFESFKEFTEPKVVLFDEIDAIFTTDQGPRGAVAGIFKQEMNDLHKKSPNVLMIGITNDTDRIDQALIRSGRFDEKFYVPLPDDRGRNQIITNIIANLVITQEETGIQKIEYGLDVQRLAGLTDGMSGADIAEIFRRITTRKAVQQARSNSSTPITQDELIDEINNFKTDTF